MQSVALNMHTSADYGGLSPRAVARWTPSFLALGTGLPNCAVIEPGPSSLLGRGVSLSSKYGYLLLVHMQCRDNSPRTHLILPQASVTAQPTPSYGVESHGKPER